MTIAAFGRPLKDNRGLSSPKGQFFAGCQARVRGTYCPRFSARQLHNPIFHDEAWNMAEDLVVAHQDRAEGQSGRGYPEVVVAGFGPFSSRLRRIVP